MPALAIPDASPAVVRFLSDGLDRVGERFRDQIVSDTPGIDQLVNHVERYRGKMLRPTLVFLSGLAVGGGDPEELGPRAVDELVTVATVLEMIHIATLVHDDVLDESSTRRGAATVNRLRGTEAAVVFGDYLISQAFHLCSSLDSQRTALRVGEVTSRVCEGEMLQLARRGDPALGRDAYFAIIERKTAALIAVAAELGALHAGGGPAQTRAMHRYGVSVGSAFQIQDDLLDLTGDADVVGKDLGKDLEKGKVTLPVVHYLERAAGEERAALERLVREDRPLNGTRRSVLAQLEAAGSIGHARQVAAALINDAKAELGVLPDSAARGHLEAIADAVLGREK